MTPLPAARPPQPREAGRSAFHASLRDSDVFICTYPRSGTTWLRYLLAQLMKPDPAEQLDLVSFNRYVPDVNREYTDRRALDAYGDLADPRIFSCHARFDAALPGIVYIIRDPRDAMLSYWHYERFKNRDIGSLDDFLQRERHWPCDWHEHVSEWLLPARHPRLLLLRYEDVRGGTAEAVRAVLRFAGVERSEAQVAAAVEAASFERMRCDEQRRPIVSARGSGDERLVRKGKIGSWREEMTARQVRLIEQRYGRVMEQMGYCPAAAA